MWLPQRWRRFPQEAWASLDLIATTAFYNLHWVLRRRFMAYLMVGYVCLTGGVLFYLGWFQATSPAPNPFLRFVALQLACNCCLAFFWTRATIRRDARTGQLEEIALTGCHPWELVVTRMLVGFGVALALLVIGLPLQMLAVAMDNVPPRQLPLVNLVVVIFTWMAAALGEFTEAQPLASEVRERERNFPAWVIYIYVGALCYMIYGAFGPWLAALLPKLPQWQGLILRTTAEVLNPFAVLASAATPGTALWLGSLAFYGATSVAVMQSGVGALRKRGQQFWQQMIPVEQWMGEESTRRRETFPYKVSPEVKQFNPVYAVSQFYARHHAPTAVEWLFFAIYTVPATLYAFSLGPQGNALGVAILLVGVFILSLIPTLVAALDIAKEREMKTLELLMVAPLTDTELFLGKVSAALRPMAPFALYLFDCALILAAGGVISWLAVLHVLLAMLIYPVTAAIIGLTFSVLCRTSVEASTAAFALLTLPGLVVLVAPHLYLELPHGLVIFSPLHSLTHGLQRGAEFNLLILEVSLLCHALFGLGLSALGSRFLRRWALRGL